MMGHVANNITMILEGILPSFFLYLFQIAYFKKKIGWALVFCILSASESTGTAQ